MVMNSGFTKIIMVFTLCISTVTFSGKNEQEKSDNKELKNQIKVLEKKNKQSLMKIQFLECFSDGDYTFVEQNKKEKKMFFVCADTIFGTIVQKDDTLAAKLPKGLPSRKQVKKINKLLAEEQAAVSANCAEIRKISQR